MRIDCCKIYYQFISQWTHVVVDQNPKPPFQKLNPHLSKNWWSFHGDGIYPMQAWVGQRIKSVYFTDDAMIESSSADLCNLRKK